MKNLKRDVPPEALSVNPHCEYPYGTKLYLDEDTIRALGISILPALGKNLSLKARVEVVAVSESDSKEGGLRRCLELQITDMELGTKKVVKPEDVYEKKDETFGKDGEPKTKSYYMVDQPDPEHMNTAHKRGVRA
jgi:hypothetical protein